MAQQTASMPPRAKRSKLEAAAAAPAAVNDEPPTASVKGEPPAAAAAAVKPESAAAAAAAAPVATKGKTSKKQDQAAMLQAQRVAAVRDAYDSIKELPFDDARGAPLHFLARFQRDYGVPSEVTARARTAPAPRLLHHPRRSHNALCCVHSTAPPRGASTRRRPCTASSTAASSPSSPSTRPPCRPPPSTARDPSHSSRRHARAHSAVTAGARARAQACTTST